MCVRFRWRRGGEQRERSDQSIRRIKASNRFHNHHYLLIPSSPPFFSPTTTLPSPVMLRANQRPPSILGDDPFSHALKPPAHELDYEKHARLEREIEAKRISDRIDDEIRRDKERFKRSKQDVKVSTQRLVEIPPSNGFATPPPAALAPRPGRVGKVDPPEAIPAPPLTGLARR